jgi:glucosylceramidase
MHLYSKLTLTTTLVCCAVLPAPRHGSEALPMRANLQEAGKVTITVDSSRTFQTMEGFGAALTDSSAWLLGKGLLPLQRKELLRTLFDAKTGAGLSYLRLPMGSSDFSLTEHTYDDLPAGQTDPALKRFSIAYDEAYIIPVLKQILAINPRLKVMASPWSAPAWMKESGKLEGGPLKKDDATYNAYAHYFVRFIQAYAAHGIPIDMVTLQNEPEHRTDRYPCMGMTPAEEIRLAKLVGARFQAAKIATKIVVWDHNWDHPEYPIQVLQDAVARRYIAGTAFHGYAGDVASQAKVHEAFPEKSLYFTESTGGSFATNFGSNLIWDMTNLLVGSTRNWAKTVLKWNLVLDEKNGPHLPGGPDNCRGIVTLDHRTGRVNREEEYYAFAHAAKFVVPGARRIFTNDPSSVAFKNPDASTAMILFNANTNSQRYRIQWKGHLLEQTLPPRSVVTLVWSADSTATVHCWMTTGDQSKLLARQPNLRFH